MPNMVIPDAGQLLWLEWALISSDVTVEDLIVHLYSNDYTPAQDSVTESFTEATFTGYSEIHIYRDSWGSPETVADTAQATYSPTPSWTCTGGSPQTVYGWYLTGATSGTTVAAQVFATPRVMSPGATEELDPFTMTLQGIGES